VPVLPVCQFDRIERRVAPRAGDRVDLELEGSVATARTPIAH